MIIRLYLLLDKLGICSTQVACKKNFSEITWAFQALLESERCNNALNCVWGSSVSLGGYICFVGVSILFGFVGIFCLLVY